MIRKAVIPAAGLGTRFLPITKSIPKEMLPIINKPIIQFVVEEAILSGINDILIVTGRGKRSIEDYFDTSPELENHLFHKKKYNLLKEVKDISSIAEIHYIRQKDPKGLGDAILKAEKHIGDEPFAVLLGDDLTEDAKPCTKQLIDVFERRERSVIAVQEIPEARISSYGIIKGECIEEDLYLMEDVVEKPDPRDAPSNLGAIGRYVFTPEIFDCIKETEPSLGDEIQIADAIKILMRDQKVYAHKFGGLRYDAGNKSDYILTLIKFAFRDEEIRRHVLDYLREEV